jgi:predicted RND superfamily exporter protein
MIEYMKKHESYVQDVLANKPDQDKLKELLAYHNQQIQWMQHERFVHLIVTLFVCLFTMIVFCFSVMQTSVPAIILFVLLLILSGAYLIHYYRLENGVQKWYLVSSQIRNALSSTKL